MKMNVLALGALAMTLASGSLASAANIFIAPSRGADLSRQDQERINGMVRRSVENMPEHKIVLSEAEADFILRPAVIRRDAGPVLRLEKSKEGELMAVAEQPLDMTISGANAQALTQKALQTDSYVGQRDIANSAPMKRDGANRNPAVYDETVSGATSSAGPAANMPPSADTNDTRSIHNEPSAQGDMNSSASVVDSYSTPNSAPNSAGEQMSGRDRQVLPQPSQSGNLSDLRSGMRGDMREESRDLQNNESMARDTGASRGFASDTMSDTTGSTTGSTQSQTGAANALADESASVNSNNVNSNNPSSSAGEVRAPSPKLMSEQTPSFFQMGVGPSFAIGLNSDNIMYNINGAYNYNVDEFITAKGFADFNIGTGSDAAQFVNLGAGAEFYPSNLPSVSGSKPYLQADLGYGFARSGRNVLTNAIDTGDGFTIGGGAGFKFEARDLNWDIAAHYALLTSQVDERTPSVLGIRAALNF